MNNEPEFIRGMVQVKKAAALANRELRVLSEDVADAIVASCDAILEEGRCMDQFPLDFFQGGAGTSVNMNTNEVVANLALELLGYKKGRYDLIHPNDHVNKSQSTNDSYPTGFRLAVFALLKELSQAIENLADAFEAKGKEFSHVLKMGRTQLQDAVPMSLGDEFIAYATTLRHEVERIAVAGSQGLIGNALVNSLRAAGHTDTIWLHGAMEAMCRLYEELGVPLGDLRLVSEASKDAMRGGIVIAPPSALNDRWSRRLPDPVTAMASGWMRVRQRARQRGVELPLVISDHADWGELTRTIEQVNPQETWITHGREEALLRWCELRQRRARA